MKLVRTVIREIAEADDDVTADDVVNAVIDKMCARGSTEQACDDIRERLIGIALCALNMKTNPGLVSEWIESTRESSLPEKPQRILHQELQNPRIAAGISYRR